MLWYLKQKILYLYKQNKTKQKMTFKQLEASLDAIDNKTEVLLYTSYYGNMKKLVDAGVVPIRIARYPPRYTTSHAAYHALHPEADILAAIKEGSITEQAYAVRYNYMLSQLNAKQVYDDLAALGKGSPVAILCYEKPPDMCHRHLVTDWFKATLDLTIPEFPYKK